MAYDYDFDYDYDYGYGGASALPNRRRLENSLLDYTATAAGTLFDILNTPASLMYDVLRNKKLGSGSTGHDVLEDYGLGFDEDTLGGWARPIQDFAFEVATDPLNLLTFGAGSANKAFKAARAAGLTDDIGRVASRKLINQVGGDATQLTGRYSQRAAKSLQDNLGKGLNDLVDDDLLSRPLMGSREARKQLSLDELVQAQQNPQAAIDSIDNFLTANGGGRYQDLAGMNLGSDIGIRSPFSLTTEAATRIPFLDDLSKGIAGIPYLGAPLQALTDMDYLGDVLRYSGPGRHLASTFDKRLLGATEEGDQIMAKTMSRADARADEISNRKIAQLMQDAPDAVFDADASRAIRAHLEGKATNEQLELIRDKNLTNFVTGIRDDMQEYIKRSQEAGISHAELKDKYLNGYFPRSLDDAMFESRRAPTGSSKDFSLTAGDQLHRDEAYSLPGGTEQVRQLSMDAAIQDAATDSDAAKYIYDKVNADIAGVANMPEYEMKHALKLARDIRGAKGDMLTKQGFFDKHIFEDYSRYIKSRERAMQRAGVMNQQLAGGAVEGAAKNQSGTGFIDAERALGDVGLATNSTAAPLENAGNYARANLLDALEKQGFDTTDLYTGGIGGGRIQDVSITPTTMRRLNKIKDFYSMGEAPSKWVKTFDDLTALWKSSILSWPARFTRDRYSGIFSNLLEVDNLSNIYTGSQASKSLMTGDMDGLYEVIKKMPKYANEANRDAAIKAYRQDLAAHGLLEGRRLDDMGIELTSKQTGDSLRNSVLPGSTPQTTTQLYTASDELLNKDAYKQGFGQLGDVASGKRSFSDFIADKELKDPILRWGNKLGDNVDSLNRLDGYNGLLLEGVDPMEASRRIKASQVDYNSLTQTEKEFFRRFMPFYSFSSRMGAYVGRKIFNDPGGRFTQLALRSQSMGDDEDSYTPQRIRESGGVNLESLRDAPIIGSAIDLLSPATSGKDSYLNDFDLPGLDVINMMDIQRTAGGGYNPLGSMYQTGLNVAGDMMHPLLRSAVEQLTGQNLYTGKDLVTYQPTLQRLAERMGAERGGAADQMAKWASVPLDYVPHAPRLLQLLSRATDTERVPDATARALQTLLNMTSGVKSTNIMEDAAQYDQMQAIDKLLGDSPFMRNYEMQYIPEEYLDLIPPEQLEFYQLKQQLAKERRAARNQ